jgi:hypothetical protein
MKRLIIIAVILTIISLSCPLTLATSEHLVSITQLITIDSWGNTNNFINRGFKASLNITIESSIDGPFLIKATLSDNCNVPASYSREKIVLHKGMNNLIINMNVTPYAFTGIANLQVILCDVENNLPVVSMNHQTYIKVLGDFDENNAVNSEDISKIACAFTSYWKHNTVLSEYQICDITRDHVIDSNDLSSFVNACITYWKNLN